MSEAATSYVHQLPNGHWRVSGSRVSLDSIVHAYWEGRLPEVIAADFPALTLEQIHGAIAFYLQHQREIDDYLQEQDGRWREFQRQCEQRHGPLLKKMRSTTAQTAGS